MIEFGNMSREQSDISDIEWLMASHQSLARLFFFFLMTGYTACTYIRNNKPTSCSGGGISSSSNSSFISIFFI